jgi:hypothetical protein
MREQDLRLGRRAFLTSAGALTCAASAGLPWIAAAAESSAGAVNEVEGEASAAKGKQVRHLSVRDAVFLEENVKTGTAARLALQLGARTRLRLGANTEIRIDRYIADAGGEVAFGEGAIEFERSGPSATAPLDFRSTYGLIAVRGTRFYAGPSNGVFGVLCGTGIVTVTAAGVSVTLKAQQGTDIARPGAAPTPPKDWGLSRIRALQALVSRPQQQP